MRRRALAFAVRGRRSNSCDGERGAALVEVAILLPIILLVTFGLIEFSSAYQSSSVATAAARSGARTASAEAMLSTFATDAAAAAATALRGVPADEPVEMWVYRADVNGLPESGNFNSCTTHCISYQWNKQTRKFDTTLPGGLGWLSNQQNACNANNWDTVGVYVRLDHKFITSLFVKNMALTHRALFRLEPAPTQLCP
jgi:Flp pilus assembly protein TadG